jgi:hypothetical protein
MIVLLVLPAAGVMAQLETVQVIPTLPLPPAVKVMLVVPCPAVSVAFDSVQL